MCCINTINVPEQDEEIVNRDAQSVIIHIMSIHCLLDEPSKQFHLLAYNAVLNLLKWKLRRNKYKPYNEIWFKKLKAVNIFAQNPESRLSIKMWLQKASLTLDFWPQKETPTAK